MPAPNASAKTTKMNRKMYLRLNIEEGVEGTRVLHNVPGLGDVKLTHPGDAGSHICERPIPENFVLGAKLHTDRYTLTRPDSPSKSVRVFRFSLAPWPMPERPKVVEPEIPLEGAESEIPLEGADDGLDVEGDDESDPNAGDPAADAEPVTPPTSAASRAGARKGRGARDSRDAQPNG